MPKKKNQGPGILNIRHNKKSDFNAASSLMKDAATAEPGGEHGYTPMSPEQAVSPAVRKAAKKAQVAYGEHGDNTDFEGVSSGDTVHVGLSKSKRSSKYAFEY